MPKEYDWETVWNLIRDNYIYADALGDDPEGYLDTYLEANFPEFFLTDVDLLHSDDPTVLAGIPRSRYADYSEAELAKMMADSFASSLKYPKDRLNLSVEGDIPILLPWLAGGERRMGSYVAQLVREDYERKREAGFDSLENGDLEEDSAWQERMSEALSSGATEPDVQAPTLENSSLEERLRTLERMVEELSRRGGS